MTITAGQNRLLDIACFISARRWARPLCVPLFRRFEILDIIDDSGSICGAAPRNRVHGDKSLLHRVVHVLITDSIGRLLLQKRSPQKRVAPGRWDTSVGGHLDFDETVEAALYREMKEELGISPGPQKFAYSYIHTNDFESELVYTYVCLHEGPFRPSPEEIEQVRFWSAAEIEAAMGTGSLSENFEDEFMRYKKSGILLK